MRSSPELDGKHAPLFTRPLEFGQIESAKRNRCRKDFILWGRLAYRIGIADEFQQP